MALLTGSLLLDFGVILSGVFGILYFYITRNFNLWKKKGIPFPKPTAFLGNFKDVFLAKKSIGHVLQDVYNENKGAPYAGIFVLDQPFLVAIDTEIIRSILVKDFNKFMNRSFAPDKVSDPLNARGLFGIDNHKWRHLRMKLTPTFTSGKLKFMFQFIDECAKDLTNYLEHNSDESLDVKHVMASFTTDVTASTIFGIQADSLKNPDSYFRKILKAMFEFSFLKSIIVAIIFFTPQIAKSFRLTMFDDYINDFVRKTIWDTVEHREKNKIVRKDFLEILMQIRKNGQVEEESSNGDLKMNDKELNKMEKFELEGDDFVAQAFTFLGAGYETSSTTMSFTLYELALHPEIQQKARDEVQSVLDKYGGKFTYDGFQEMTYLHNVISEALRKYPVLPFLDRRVLSDYTLPGSDIVLEEGLGVIIPVLGLHRDPEYYPEPERFDPDRFTEESKRLRPNFAYLPFGEGPRNCIGSRMGMLQAKVGLAHILARFEVSPRANTPIPLVINPKSFLMNIDGPLPLTFKRVKK